MTFLAMMFGALWGGAVGACIWNDATPLTAKGRASWVYHRKLSRLTAKIIALGVDPRRAEEEAVKLMQRDGILVARERFG